MLAAAIGIVSAFIFGCADFLGGLASRRSHAVLVTATSAATGLVLLGVTLPLTGGVWSIEAVMWGALSGVAGALAIALLYACLAIGPMSILSPLTAVVSALVPVGVGLARGETFGTWGYVGLALALVAVVLVGFVPERGAVRPNLKGVLMAIGSGAMIGLFLVLFDLAPDDSGLIPLVFNRLTNASLMAMTFAVLLLTRRVSRPVSKAGLKIAVGGGLVDAVANSLLLVGVRVGDLSVMGVLSALYPIGTIVLAATIGRERIAPVQWAGLVLALGSVALLSLS